MLRKEYLILLLIVTVLSVLFFKGKSNKHGEDKSPTFKQTKIELYIKKTCPYCIMAKSLLDDKGVIYIEIDIEKTPEQKSIMISRSKGAATVPQIFIDGRHIGGFSELKKLEDHHLLDDILWYD